MPTRPGADLVPVRKETKTRLAALKGSRSFDQLLRTLLERAEEPSRAPLDRPRTPDEQLALADLAARRWDLALALGVLEEIGPRLIVYRTGKRERARLDVRRA